MLFNDVDIYTCKFFSLNNDKKLKFMTGKHKGKIADDFNTITDLHHVTSYCFWILKGKDIPLVSKYFASAFLKEIASKYLDLEKKLRKKTIQSQNELKKETEDSTKIVGKKYV